MTIPKPTYTMWMTLPQEERVRQYREAIQSYPPEHPERVKMERMVEEGRC